MTCVSQRDGLFLPSAGYRLPPDRRRRVPEEAGAGQGGVGPVGPGRVESRGIVVPAVGDDAGVGGELAGNGHRIGVRLHVDDHDVGPGAAIGGRREARVGYRSRDLRSVEQVTDEGYDAHL
jgi:hypothetical protein